MPDKLMVEKVARAIYEALPIINYPNVDCIDSGTALSWDELHDHEKDDARKRARAAIQSDTSVSEAMIEAGVGVLMSFPENTDLKDAVGPIYLAMRSISSETDHAE